MNTTTLTRVLTGDLPAILIMAAILTYPVSVWVLWLYRRAVTRSMSSETPGGHPVTASPLPDVDTAASTISSRSSRVPATVSQSEILRLLRSRPWRTAALYTVAGTAYGFVLALTMAYLAEPGAPFRPVRLLLLTTLFAWPVVLTTAIVAAAVRTQRVAIAAAYAVGYLTLGMIAAGRNPDVTAWQALQLWLITNGPMTVILWLCLARRIRAVGAVVLMLLLGGLLGADLLVTVISTSDASIDAVAAVGGWLGMGGAATFAGTLILGFAVSMALSVAFVHWLRRRYEQKRFSDESLTIRTIWWIFAFGHAITLAFEHPLAPLIGVVAMFVFSGVVRLGQWAMARADRGVNLLLLRSFSIGAASERLFDALEKGWRRTGSIQMIAGYDLASRTVELHELLDFASGKLARRFIGGRPALERRLREMDVRPDRDGRYRVNDFFCYGDTWRDVLLALIRQTDVVLMDLRGFSQKNAGCVFEIQELVRAVPIERIVFVVDSTTDHALLERTFSAAAAQAGKVLAVKPFLFQVPRLDVTTMGTLLQELAAAAHGRQVVTAGSQ